MPCRRSMQVRKPERSARLKFNAQHHNINPVSTLNPIKYIEKRAVLPISPKVHLDGAFHPLANCKNRVQLPINNGALKLRNPLSIPRKIIHPLLPINPTPHRRLTPIAAGVCPHVLIATDALHDNAVVGDPTERNASRGRAAGEVQAITEA